MTIADGDKKEIAKILRQVAHERMATAIALLVHAHQIGGQKPPWVVAAQCAKFKTRKVSLDF